MLISADQISLDARSVVPIYQQLATQVHCIIQLVQMPVGSQLPPIRVMAGWLKVNPNTVARAYEELAAVGVITKRRGSGCVVAGRAPDSATGGVLTAALTARIDELIAAAVASRVELRELLERIRQRYPSTPARHRAGGFEPGLQPIRANALATPEPKKVAPDRVASIWQPDDDFID